MNDSTKYESMKQAGASPEQIYRACKADGLNEIVSIGRVRRITGLSLAEVKRALGFADTWDRKQEVQVGCTVSWEGSSTEEGFYLMEAKVTKVVKNMVYLDGHRKFQLTESGLKEVPVTSKQSPVPMRHFQKSLSERLEESLKFWDSLTHVAG